MSHENIVCPAPPIILKHLSSVASSAQLVSPSVAHPAELVHFYFDMHHSLTVVSSDCTNFFTGSRDSTYENIRQEGGNQHLFHSSKYSILVDAKIVYVICKLISGFRITSPLLSR